MLLLDKVDTRILALLRQHTTHSSRIARELGLPRTTVSFRLVRLKKWKRVESAPEGRRVVWQISEKRQHSKELLKIYAGLEFYECYKLFSTLPKEAVVYGVQGTEAGPGEFKTIPHSLITEMHRMFKRKNIQLHAVANKKLLEVFSSLQKGLRESHVGRPQGIKLVDRLFVSHGEVFVTKTFAILSNPGKRRAVVIKDSEIVNLLFDLMFLFFNLSDQLQTFDLNRYLAEINEN